MLRSSTTLPFQFIRDGMFNSEKTYVLFSEHIKDTLILDCRSLMRWQTSLAGGGHFTQLDQMSQLGGAPTGPRQSQ